MALDPSKVVYGPFNVSFKDSTPAEVFGVTGLKYDAVKFSGETKEGSIELEDGKEKFWTEGRKLVVEITVTQLDTSDLANIEDNSIVSVELTFLQANKTITISNPDQIVTHIDEGFKTRIKITKTGDVSQAWGDILSL